MYYVSITYSILIVLEAVVFVNFGCTKNAVNRSFTASLQENRSYLFFHHGDPKRSFDIFVDEFSSVGTKLFNLFFKNDVLCSKIDCIGVHQVLSK